MKTESVKIKDLLNDPLYCDVIVKRWENLTGETAHRESVAPIK